MTEPDGDGGPGARLQAEVGQVPGVDGLLPGGPHGGEIGVARLVGLVGDGYQGRGGGGQRLAQGPHGAGDQDLPGVGDLQGGGQGEGGHAQGGRQRPRQHGGHGVQRGHAGDDQVHVPGPAGPGPADAPDGGGQGAGGGDDVGPGQGLVGDEHAGVGAHLEGAAQAVLGVLGPHGQGDDLAAEVLDEGDGGLDGVLVELVEDVVLPAHEPAALQTALRLHVGDVLDADHDFHAPKIAISRHRRRRSESA